MNEPIMPPPGPPADNTAGPVPSSVESNEAFYFLHVLDRYREIIQQVSSNIPPLELLVVLGFLQAALEVQLPVAREAFEEVRGWFDLVYPGMLNHFRNTSGEEIPENQLLIVTPSIKGSNVLVTPAGEESKLLTPGSRLIQ
jgi:hypothetical protein